MGQMHTKKDETNTGTGTGRGSGPKGPAKGHAFGVAAVTQALEGVHFLIAKQELIRQHGKEQIHWTKDSSESLGDLLKRTPDDEFASVAELAVAVSEAHKSGQRRRGEPCKQEAIS